MPQTLKLLNKHHDIDALNHVCNMCECEMQVVQGIARRMVT